MKIWLGLPLEIGPLGRVALLLIVLIAGAESFVSVGKRVGAWTLGSPIATMT